jgi:hypothetical protein
MAIATLHPPPLEMMTTTTMRTTSLLRMPEHICIEREPHQSSMYGGCISKTQLLGEEAATSKMSNFERMREHTSYRKVKFRVQYRMPWLVGPPPHLQHNSAYKAKRNAKVSAKNSKDGSSSSSKRCLKRELQTSSHHSKTSQETGSGSGSDFDAQSVRSGLTDAASAFSESSSVPMITSRGSSSFSNLFEEGLTALPIIEESDFNSPVSMLTSKRLMMLSRTLDQDTDDADRLFSSSFGCFGGARRTQEEESSSLSHMLDRSLASSSQRNTSVATLLCQAHQTRAHHDHMPVRMLAF